MSQQKVQEKFSKIRELIIGLGILIQIGAIATYILLWKYRSRQQNQGIISFRYFIRVLKNTTLCYMTNNTNI